MFLLIKLDQANFRNKVGDSDLYNLAICFEFLLGSTPALHTTMQALLFLGFFDLSTFFMDAGRTIDAFAYLKKINIRKR